jgi:D-alanyl-D-alanine carboxypeptidase/D-alanyl-D-alanine-endopeptidase (penicillin-binding protein 4)
VTTPAIRLWIVLFLLAVAAIAEDSRGGLRAFLAMEGERLLASENPELRMAPGSVLKLVTAAAAIHHLGLEYRVETVARAAGSLTQGTLEGDLVVVAAGDPTWNERFFPSDPRAPLRQMARQLLARGLRRVTGDLVVDRSRFPGRGAAVSRPSSELAYAYAAPSSSLAIDENTIRVKIAPGRRVGDPAILTPTAGAARLDWVNQMRTVSRARHEHGTVDFLPVWGTSTFVVRGEYPLSEPPYQIAVSVPDPERHAALALAAIFAEEGISIAGEVRVSVKPSAPGEVLARFASPPLAELLKPILTNSHNFYAEALLRILAAEVAGEGRDDEGLKIVASFLTGEIGVGEETFLLDDGSGLSPYNLLSPEVVVALLRWVLEQSWHEAFVAVLARPGAGTLRAWGRLPAGLVAKTGTIRSSLGLAGYLRRPSGEPVVFAIFLGHRQRAAGALRPEITAWLRELERLSPP